jgi:uncharacterized protein (TIGR02452 family)
MELDYIEWLNTLKNASFKKEKFRELRIKIFTDTIKFVQSGYKIEDRKINIDNENIISEYFEKPEKLSGQTFTDTKYSVICSDCLEAAQLLLGAGFNPCVLNMASRQHPGGGVLNGAGAQEENLFRRTNLFMSLYQFAPYANEYGLEKSKNQYPLNGETGGI